MSLDYNAYNSGRSKRTMLLIFVVCILFASVWAYVFFRQKPRVADGAVESITAIPVHSELRQGGTMFEGYGGGVQKTDEVLVWVQFSMENLTEDVPLYESGQRATLTFTDGEQMFADAVSPLEIAKARAALPQLGRVQGTLVPRDLTLAPRAGTSGLALFAFPITLQRWNARKQFSMEISFRWQRPLALKEPNPPVSDMLPTIGK